MCLQRHAYGCVHIIFLTRSLYVAQGIVQLKDGEESEVNGVTCTVELHVRTVCVNGAEQQRCTAHSAPGVVLCFGGLRVHLVRNDNGNGGGAACQCGSFLRQVYYNRYFNALFHFHFHLDFLKLWASVKHHKLFLTFCLFFCLFFFLHFFLSVFKWLNRGSSLSITSAK